MIDPKLNELPIDPNDEIANAGDGRVTEKTQAESGKRRGLSVNDTVASNANLSVGSRGVDTSGVKAGAGAGAGMAMTAAGETGESPAPQIMGGDRGAGTTTLGTNNSKTTGSTVPATGSGISGGAAESGHLAGDLAGSEGEIAALAYNYWCDRGCPVGSPEVDWKRAEEKYRASKGGVTARSARA